MRVDFLFVSWVPSRHKGAAFPWQDDKSLFHLFTHPCTAEAAISASCCTSYRMCRFISRSCPVPPWNLWPLLSLLSPAGAPHVATEGQMTLHGKGPCSKGPAAVAASVSGTAESPSSGQTPGLCPQPGSTAVGAGKQWHWNCSCIVCKVCPFFCACSGWVWVVFSLNYEQEEKMCLFPEQRGRKETDSSRKWAKQNKKIIMVMAKLWPWIKRSCIKSHSRVW